MSRMELHAWVTFAAFAAILVALTIRMFAIGNIDGISSGELALTAAGCYLLFAIADFFSGRFLLRRHEEGVTDERDQMISRRAGSAALGFVVLATLLLVHQTIAGHQAEPDALSLIDLGSAPILFYCLLAVFLGTFLVHRGAIIVTYRMQATRAE